MDTKFKEAIEEVETATFDLELPRLHKNELKKGEGDDTPQQAVGAGKAAPDKAKKLKKAEGEEFPQVAVIAAKAVVDTARKARNKAQE